MCWRSSRAARSGKILGHAADQIAGAAQFAVGARFDVDQVAEIDQCESTLQFVIAVGAPSQHVQEQVQLGRCRQGEGAFHFGRGVKATGPESL